MNDDAPCDQSEPQTGRQMAVAVVMHQHPPDLLANLCTGLKKSYVRIFENISIHYAVPLREQSEMIVTDELLIGVQQASILQPDYEMYSFATRHHLSEAAAVSNQ